MDELQQLQALRERIDTYLASQRQNAVSVIVANTDLIGDLVRCNAPDYLIDRLLQTTDALHQAQASGATTTAQIDAAMNAAKVALAWTQYEFAA